MTTDGSSDLFSVEPNQLYFPPPYHNRVIQNDLLIYNKHEDVGLVFKIKAATPSRYGVRPVCGVVKPRGVIRVSVSLKAVADGKASMFLGDKFKIIAKKLPTSSAVSTAPLELWDSLSRHPVDFETVLPCHFVASEEIPPDAGIHYLPVADELSSDRAASAMTDAVGGRFKDKLVSLKQGEETLNELQTHKSALQEELSTAERRRNNAEMALGAEARAKGGRSEDILAEVQGSLTSSRKGKSLMLRTVLILMLAAHFAGIAFKGWWTRSSREKMPM